MTNTSFLTTDSIRITATASDLDGRVVQVTFLSDGVVLGTDTTAPYEFNWSNPPAGSHTLTVRAVDDGGATTVSASRQVSVATPTPNQVPTVSMAAPANNFKANAPTAVLLSANASDADGTIAKVEFFRVDPLAPVFDATTLVGQGTAVGAPPAYQFTTAALPAGTYNFVARATDNKGDTATSGSVQVTMNALPAVSITAPTAGASIIPGTIYTLRATASDGDGSISKVEFFLNGGATPLPGPVTKSGNEYSLGWTAVTGAVSFTARATDNDGAQTTTASVAANVPPNGLPTVTLDNPMAGINAPTTLNLSASAADGDGSVTGVEFSYALNGGAVIKANGTLTAGKWTLAVPIGAAQFGTYSVTATATDNLGGKTTSPSKDKTIAANVPPTVVMTTSPATVNLPSTVVLSASAGDSDGIAKVEFFNINPAAPVYDSSTKLGEDSTAPTYQFDWGTVAAGTYSIAARATDNVGTVNTSTVQTLVVNPNTVGMWSTLSEAQKAGLTMVPNLPITDGGTDAVQVLTGIGVNMHVPKFVAAMAQAARSLADAYAATGGFAQTNGFVSCPNGGSIQVFGASANRILNYDNCVLGGFTLFGGGGMGTYPQVNTVVPPGTTLNPQIIQIGSAIDYEQLSADSFRIRAQGAKATGNGAPVPGGKTWPRNAFEYGTIVNCSVSGAAMRCLTYLDGTFLWGHDLSWSGYNAGARTDSNNDSLYATDDSYILSGTYRPHYCSPDPDMPNNGRDYCLANPPAARHIRYEAMTNVGGRAIVYGSNGYSVVERLTPASPGVERVRVTRTIGGSTLPSETYQCAVGSITGDWACSFVP